MEFKTKQNKPVHILFTGRRGTGKSALINSLVGKEVAKEGEDLTPETMEVLSYNASASITVWDSPGLQDGTGNEASYIEALKTKCGNRCDLVAYCIGMTEPRIAEDEHRVITTLTREFGEDIWMNAVFVLLRANMVIRQAPKKDPNYFEKRFNFFEKTIPEVLMKCGIKRQVAESIPIIPAGHHDIGEVGGGPVLSPITNDWLSKFWFTSIRRMKDSGKPGMVLSSAARFKKEEEITKERRDKSASQQPIGYLKEHVPAPQAPGGMIGALMGIFRGALGVTREQNEATALELASKLSLRPIKTVERVCTRKSVRILFTGKTGVGKSTLINNLVGKVVAKEGDEFSPQTMEEQSYTTSLNGVDITFWHSSGLQDGIENIESYIEEMSAKCGQGCDLIVYCIKMTETRFTCDETKAIKILTKAFGEDIWRNAVFVLTYANQVLLLAPKKDPQGHLQKRFDLFNKTILTTLNECGIKKEIVDSIPIIPAGLMDVDRVDCGPVLSPLTNDWLKDVWFTTIMRMKESGRQSMNGIS